MVELSLIFEDNRSGHDDLVLRFAGNVWRCDSYYLALDDLMLPQRNDAEKIRLVLQTLLEQWVSAAESLTDGGTVFLPYDFSDQYTGWLSCSRSGDTVAACRGWTGTIEGWAIAPSAVGHYLFSLPDFRATGPSIRVPAGDFIAMLRKLIS